MCHNTVLDEASENEQIERCVEGGMPLKIIKALKCMMRKRANEYVKYEEQTVNNSNIQKDINEKIIKKYLNAISTTVYSHIMKDRESSMKLEKVYDRRLEETLKLQYKTDMNNKSIILQSKNNWCIETCMTWMHINLCKLINIKAFKLLTQTTQPAHILAIGILFIVLYLIWPELHRNIGNQVVQSIPDKEQNILVILIYLAAFAAHFGAQIWMTFVSGLSLYFSLPRHIFGQCQRILFPKYFTLNASLSIIMLILYVKYFSNTWTFIKIIQVMTIALTGIIEVIVRLYLTPPLLRLMIEKYKIEDTIGSGNEIGNLVQGDLIKCPHYQRMHKTFRSVHMIVAVGNILTLMASCFHLHYLASHIHITI